MRRYILATLIFLAMAGCAVAQIPNRFLPAEITGRDKVEATAVECTNLTIDGTPISTGSTGYWMTTATDQAVAGKKTYSTSQTFDGPLECWHLTTKISQPGGGWYSVMMPPNGGFWMFDTAFTDIGYFNNGSFGNVLYDDLTVYGDIRTQSGGVVAGTGIEAGSAGVTSTLYTPGGALPGNVNSEFKSGYTWNLYEQGNSAKRALQVDDTANNFVALGGPLWKSVNVRGTDAINIQAISGVVDLVGGVDVRAQGETILTSTTGVTLGTAQVISGAKTFSTTITATKFKSSTDFLFDVLTGGEGYRFRNQGDTGAGTDLAGFWANYVYFTQYAQFEDDVDMDGTLRTGGQISISDSTNDVAITHAGSGGGDWWVQRFGGPTSTTGWKYQSGSPAGVVFYRSNSPHFFFWTGTSTPGFLTNLPIRSANGADLRLSPQSGTDLVAWLMGANDDFYVRSQGGAELWRIDQSAKQIQHKVQTTMNAATGQPSSLQINSADSGKALYATYDIHAPTDNLVELQANGRTLTANWSSRILEIYKANNTVGAYGFNTPLSRVWDNDPYSINDTGPLYDLRWTNARTGGTRAMMEYTLPSAQGGANGFFWKVGNDLGNTLTFEADMDGNIVTDGDVDADDYTSAGGGAAQFSQGAYTYDQISILSGGFRSFLGSNSGYAILGSAASGTGGAIALSQGGFLPANNTDHGFSLTRIGILSGFNYTKPVMLVEEALGASATDTNTTLRLRWSNGFSAAGGKVMLELDPDAGGSGLDADDYLFKRTGRSDFYLDFAGNLELPGKAKVESVTVEAISTPAAPAAGVTFFANSSDTPSVIASNGTTSALISQFVGQKAEGELSTTSTTYTTATTLTFDIGSLSGHRMMFFCEVAGADTSTSCDVRVIVDDVKVVSERNFLFGETYANSGWQSYCGFNWDPAPIGSHTVKIQYKTRNAAKTVYIRRIRATCERCY